MSITSSVVPAPTDYLGARGVVDATLLAVDRVESKFLNLDTRDSTEVVARRAEPE